MFVIVCVMQLIEGGAKWEVLGVTKLKVFGLLCREQDL